MTNSSLPIVASRIISKDVTASEIKAVKEYASKHGGIKRIEDKLANLNELMEIPSGTNNQDLLKANLHILKRALEYSKKHGGIERLRKEVEACLEVAALTQGGSLERVRMAVDFLKNF